MTDVDSTTQRRRRPPAWVYMLGGAIVLLSLHAFLFRRGMLQASSLNSPVLRATIALLGIAFGWLAYRITSQRR